MAKLFRLGLNIPSVKLMHVSLLSSYRELLFLFMVVLVFTSLLGPLVFLVEYTADGNVNDMFTSFWWATITMTTVGYDDNYPITFGGRIMDIVCAVIGVLILAMPIGILVSSFNDKHLNYKLLEFVFFVVFFLFFFFFVFCFFFLLFSLSSAEHVWYRIHNTYIHNSDASDNDICVRVSMDK